MALINVSDLTFYYDGSYDIIFDHVSFQIDTDWKLGFFGRNGRGKTTFLNLLMGKYEYNGTISSPVGFDYFPFPVTDKLQNTIDIIELIHPEYELWKVCKELTLLEVDCEVLYRPFETLSNGEQTKVLLAVLFSKENNFLLIDEPTNHLDMDTRIVVRNYLNGKKGFILVSHDRSFLDGCIDHVLAINKANIEVRQGNFSTWWENKKNQDEYELAENEKLKKDIKRLTEAAKRTENWSDQIEKSKIGTHVGDRGFIGHKSAKMMKRAKSIESRSQNALEEKSKLLKNIEEVDDLKIIPLKHHKDTLINIEDLSISYGDRRLFENLNLSVKTGDRIVLKGKNGCGKSSILKLILGEDIAHTGKVELASGLIISYVSQDTSKLSGSLSDFIYEHKLDESLFKAILRKLDFSRVQFEKRIEEYSGGQKKKVLIAKSLCEQAHLYLWDEPLNFIDIFSRMQIEQLIKQYAPTMLMVEHDKTFVNEIATNIYSFQ